MNKCTAARFLLIILLIQTLRADPSSVKQVQPSVSLRTEERTVDDDATVDYPKATTVKTEAKYNRRDTPPLSSVSSSLSSSYSIPDHGDAQIRTIRKQSNGIRTKSLPPVTKTARADSIPPKAFTANNGKDQKRSDSGDIGIDSDRKEKAPNEMEDMLATCVRLEDIVIYVSTGFLLLLCMVGYYLFQINVQRGKLTGVIEKKDRDLCQLKDQLEGCEEKLRSGREQTDRALQEKKEALSRLEKAASQGLRKGAGITDLRTENRPTKIAESYRELYDNEWTEAMCELTNDNNLSEKDAIAFLLKGLWDAYEFAQNMYDQRLGMLRSAVRFPDYKAKQEERDKDTLPNDCEYLVKELVKSSAECMLESLKEEYIGTIKEKSAKYTTAVIQYLKKCVEVTWFMKVQLPPMSMEDGTSHGSAFDNAQYGRYTVQGTIADFLVWPLIRVEEGGTMLSKGVVQPIKAEG